MLNRTWRIVIGAAVAAFIVTVVVIRIAVAGQPIPVSAPSLAAIEAWSSYANVLISVSLLAAAVLAWRSSQAQIAQTERHYRDRQVISVWPVVQLGAIASNPADGQIELFLENVGLGPAINVSIEGFAIAFAPTTSAEIQASHARFNEKLEALRAGHLPDPELTKKVENIGVNQTKGPFALVWGPTFAPDAIIATGGQGCLVYRITYTDAFGNPQEQTSWMTFIPLELMKATGRWPASTAPLTLEISAVPVPPAAAAPPPNQ